MVGATPGPVGADAELVRALLAGDEPSFARLVDAWGPVMVRVARAYVGSRETAEDVVQEAWIEMLRGLPRFEGRSSLRTWVFHIMVNLARRRGARERRTEPLGAGDEGPTVAPARFEGPGGDRPGTWRRPPSPWPVGDTAGPEELVLGGEAGKVLATALEQLPERQRAVIELRDVRGYGAAEVCALLELTPGNQRVLLHRARAFVRQQLADYLTGEER